MRYCIILVMSLFMTSCCSAQDKTQQILKELEKNLSSIRNATYETRETSWEPYQIEDDVMDYHLSTYEVDYPSDPYTQSQYISKNSENGCIIMCYDGKRRMRTNIEDHTFEIDSLFKGITEYRVVGVPFYHACKRMVNYALNPTDSISLTINEKEKTYELDITIYSDLQVEFTMAKPDPHLGEETRAYVEDPTGHYIIDIDKKTILPTGYYRLLCHNNSHEWIVGEPIFNQDIKGEFNCFDYIPEGYINLNDKEQDDELSKTNNQDNLIGGAAPNWQLKDENGRTVNLSDLKGKNIILMFTGIGCGPCKQAIPYLNELTEKYDRNKFQIIALECWKRNAADIKGYKKHNNILFDMLADGASVQNSYNLNGSVPHFFFINEKGIITHHFQGWANHMAEEFSQILDSLGIIR